MKQRVFIWVFILFYAGVGFAWAGEKPSKSAVFLEITDGDTAFMIEPDRQNAWWLVGECKKPIPITKGQSSNGKSVSQQQSSIMMRSEMISETVQIGVHQVELRQQFRFNLSDDPIGTSKVEVYNSLRGGWSDVPVTRNAQCSQQSDCRRRMEAPEC